MGRVVPKSIRGRIDFFNARAQEWQVRAAEIGLEPELAHRWRTLPPKRSRR